MKKIGIFILLIILINTLVAQLQVGDVARYSKISNQNASFGSPLSAYDEFGIAICNLGDINGDGVNDLAVGAAKDN